MKKLLSILLCFLLLSTGSVVSQTTLLQYTYQVVMAGQTSIGTQNANIVLSGSSFHQLTWTVSGTVATCSVKVDSSADGVNWNNGDIIGAQTCTTNGTINSSSFVANFVRINLTALSGAGATFNAILDGFSQNPAGGGGAVSTVFGRSGAVVAVSGDYNLGQISSGAIANNSTATTQAVNDNSTKVGTTAYSDRVIANPLFTGNSTINALRLTADFVSAAAGQTPITGFAWTLPANTAATYFVTCSITGSQATANSAITISFNDVSLAPSAGSSWSFAAMTAATAFSTTRSGSAFNATGSITLLTFTPASVGAAFGINSWFKITQPSGIASVLQVEMGVSGGANTVTLLKDSVCWLSTTAN